MIAWKSPKTVPTDGTEVLIKTSIGVVSAWFCNESPTPGSDDGHYEWVCYDDAFNISVDGGCPGDVIEGWFPLESKEVDGKLEKQNDTESP